MASSLPVNHYDVFGNPPVPEQLRNINRQIATTCNTARKGARIDYGAYAASFIPDRAMHRRPTISSLIRSHNEDAYIGRFHQDLYEESLADSEDITRHNQYAVTVAMQHVAGSTTCLLKIPCLRTSDLSIGIEDIVSLRQLTVNRHIPCIDVAGHEYSVPDYDFTGFEHRSRVDDIDIPNETVTLRLDPNDHLQPDNGLFNVVFTTSLVEFTDQMESIALIQELLDETTPREISRLERTNRTGEGADPDSEAHALAPNPWIRRMLFPDQTDASQESSLTRMVERRYFDSQQLNYEQKRAVDSVCERHHGELPFLISGPHGTGKTKTIVECVLQLSKRRNSHILLCAPSDPAADLLAQRLAQHLKHGDFLRLNAPRRPLSTMPRNLLPNCWIDGDQFNLPAYPQLSAYKVVVTTCKDAAMLVLARLTNRDLSALEDDHTRLHWSALLIDEASLATESEAAIPISVVAPPSFSQAISANPISANPIFVMAGDEMQPGADAKTEALKISLFERLSNRPLYKDHPLARSKIIPALAQQDNLALIQTIARSTPPPFSDLFHNYQTAPAILNILSELYYHSTLIPNVAEVPLAQWTGWNRHWQPLYFRSSRTGNAIKARSGYYNVDEAREACDTAKTLVQSNLIRPRDICITSPFRAQVHVLRAMLLEEDMGDVVIVPTATLQKMRAARLVIFCTTLTERVDFVQGESEHRRLLNVALGAAREGLIVFGNPDVLEFEGEWAQFLDYCGHKGLWQGTVMESGLTENGFREGRFREESSSEGSLNRSNFAGLPTFRALIGRNSNR